MFKGFQNTRQQFKGFPNLNHQMNNEAYGFSGATCWLDAAYGLFTQTDLAAVNKWIDRISGVSFEHATAGNQPRLQAADANFNNNPSIDFHDANRFLGSSRGLAIASQFTLAFIAKINTANSANTLLSTGDSGGGGANDNVILGGAGTLVGIGAYNTNTPIMTSTIEDTLPHICVITNNEIVVDGVQRVTGTWNPLINYTKIGFDTYAGGARNSIARVAEIISYKQKLSSSSCIELSNRINSKYAIY